MGNPAAPARPQVPQSDVTAQGWFDQGLPDIPLDSLGSVDSTATNNPAAIGQPPQQPAQAQQPPQAAQPEAQPAQVAPPAPQPQVQQPVGPFLRTATGTVYNTPEDAVRGTEEKDRIIQRLREDYVRQTGVDPITGQSASQRQAQERKKQLYDMSLKALAGGDPEKFYEAQAAIAADVLNSTLAPIVPAFSNMAKASALSTASRSNPEMSKFVGSQEYTTALAARPKLQMAIQRAESEPGLSQDLPDLYQMAYDVHTALRASSPGQVAPQQHFANQQPQPSQQFQQPAQAPAQYLSQPQQAQPQPQAWQQPQPPYPVQTTMRPSALPPQQPQPRAVNTNYYEDRSARKQAIEDLRRRGVQDVSFGDIAL